MQPQRHPLIVFLVLASATGACSAADPEGSAPTSIGGSSVEVVNVAYSPPELEIEVGTEVRWTNMDAGVHHTVTSGLPGDNGVPGVSKPSPAEPDGLFDGDLPDAGAEFAFKFDEVGSFTYFCMVHPSMTGRVVVT